MKKLFLASVAFIFASGMYASTLLQNENYGLGVEFLYWSPLDSTLWAQEQTTISVGTVTRIETNEIESEPNFKPAFRVKGWYGLNSGATLETRLTYFNGGTHDSASAPAGSTLILVPANIGLLAGSANLKENRRYVSVDLTLHNCEFNLRNWHFNFLEGLHWFWMKKIVNTEGVSATGIYLSQNQKFQAWALGPEFGLNLRYPFACCCGQFSLVGDARGMLLASHFHYNNLTSLIDTGTSLFSASQSSKWKIIPGFDLKLGLMWQTLWSGCMTSHLAVGYEFLWYHEALKPNGEVFNGFNEGFHGPYLDLGVIF